MIRTVVFSTAFSVFRRISLSWGPFSEKFGLEGYSSTRRGEHGAEHVQLQRRTQHQEAAAATNGVKTAVQGWFPRKKSSRPVPPC